ncbi:MAG TPA: xyloglucanase [Terriglobales bacterium]|nr:xyloglucanase [Terriglobales bacterium]
MTGIDSLDRRASRVGALLLVVFTALMGVRLAPPDRVYAASQTYAFNNVVTGGGGGYVPDIIFNPKQQNLVYARTDIGGAYRWNATTSSWTPLLDFTSPADWNLMGVESIATDPVDPNRLVIAVGTYTNNFTTQNGAILRSTDQGRMFQRTDLPFKNGGNMPARSMGERLAIDPNDDAIVYFGTRSGHGLWRSTDFGTTWSQVTSFTAVGDYVEKAGDNYLGDPDGIVWEAFDPRTGSAGKPTQTIYVGVATKTGPSVWRSTDGGSSWAAVPGQPTGFLPQHGLLASTGQLYITFDNQAGPFDGTSGDVWKYATATGTWTKISPVPSTDTSNDYFGYGGLTVDAQHPDTIMVSALNSWWPDTMLWRSTNAGASWTRIWDFTSYPSRSLRYAQDISAAPWLDFGVPSSQAVPPVPSPKLGWMVSGLAIDPFNSDHMLYGTGATVYGTSDLTNWDRGTTFHISVAAAGLEEMAALDLISPPTGPPLVSAVGDDGGFVHTDLTKAPAEMFTQPVFTTTTSIDFAEKNPAFMVRVQNSTSTSGAANIGFTFSNGGSWFQGNGSFSTNSGGGTVAAAADASRVVWAPTSNAAPVSFSTDNGNSWTSSTGIPQGAEVHSDRVNPSKFYGLANGTFSVSTNGGATFTAAATGLPTTAHFKAIPGIEGDIWLAAGSGGLLHSTSSGASFTRVASVTAADAIGFGKAAPGQTYPALFAVATIGGVRGIFRSDDAGGTWVRINDDAHQYGVISGPISGDPRIYGRVYFGTNGRGIIYGDIAGSQTPDFSLSSASNSIGVVQGSSSSTTISVAPSGGFSGSVAFSVTGAPAGVTATVSPTSSGTGTTLSVAASTTATEGTSRLTVTGTSGTLTHSVAIALTVNNSAPPDFAIAATPASLSVPAGSSGTSTITITPAPSGGPGPVTLSASGLPAGVAASFTPDPVSSGNSVLSLTASSTAAAGTATVTVTGTGSSVTHSVSIALTVTTSSGGGTGGVTLTSVVSSGGPYFNEEDLTVSNTGTLTALSITIVVQRTTGLSFNGQYNTVGSSITQSNTSTASTITYQFGLASGSTLGAGTGWKFAAQTSGSGTTHPTAGDTFTVTYTTGGTTFTQTGHF